MCSAVIVFILGSIVAESFAGLLLLRHSETYNSWDEFTCISEDDDGALIWNHNYTTNASGTRQRSFPNFEPKKRPSEKVTECAIWNSTKCHARWREMLGWDLVNSRTNAMAPVLDFRWEGFSESVSTENIASAPYQYVGQVNESFGSAVFSARGTWNVFVLLCVNKDLTQGLCFWIIIGGYEGRRCIIRSCAGGAPKERVPPMQGNCVHVKTEGANEVLAADEWRTFRLTWDGDTKTVKLYKESDPEDKPFLKGEMPKWGPVSHISIRSDKGSRVRFHFYEYLLTEKNNATISTAEFSHYDELFCVRLLVGLCPKCRLDVTLVDVGGRNIEIGSVYGHENSTYDGVLTWRSVKLNKKLENLDQKQVQLQIRAVLTAGGIEGRWAIDNFRLCEPVGKTRVSTLTPPEMPLNSIQNSPGPSCQKLYYGDNAVIDSQTSEIIDVNTSALSRKYTKLLESCGPPCANFGERWSLCTPVGCTCSRGFTGFECSNECFDGRYGYNCTEMCGSCENGACDKRTGFCGSGCEFNNSLPPLCKIEIPIVTNVTDTTAVILQELELAPEVMVASIVVRIRTTTAVIEQDITRELTRSEIPSTYETEIQGLTLDTMYVAQTIVKVKQARGTTQVVSPETSFTTTCFMNPEFILTAAERSLGVTVKDIKDCTNNPRRSYSILVYDIVKNMNRVMKPKVTFPVMYESLTPHTEYQVNISDEKTRVILFSKKIYTSESAPSPVQNLTGIGFTDTEIAIRWDPPMEENGVIRYYNVSVKEDELLACKKKKLQTNAMILTVTERMINLTNLHPYASYKVTVTAYTTKPGESKTQTFETLAADIPTSKISNLRLNPKNLNRLEWDEPENCTAITGPTTATRLYFRGVSESVKNWNNTRQTALKYFHLNVLHLASYAEYRVHVHVIRAINQSDNPDIYEKIVWRTLPIAPTAVRNLTTYDADSNKSTISLRWLPPNPANGEIEFYRVTVLSVGCRLSSMKDIQVSDEKLKCDTKWEHFVCYQDLVVPSITGSNTAEIRVRAFNKNVKEDGALKSVIIRSRTYDTKPSKPKIIAITPIKFGIVTLNWEPPIITPTRITQFYIVVRFLNTTLKANHINKDPISMVHPVYPGWVQYSVKFHLLTSTVYEVSVATENQRGFKSTKSSRTISIPASIGFTSGEILQVAQIGTSIVVTAPAVLNATDDTWVYVVVKGLTTCVPTNSQTRPSRTKKMEWAAAKYKVENEMPVNLTIGADYVNGVQWNCSFYMGEIYSILLYAKARKSGAMAELESSSITLTIGQTLPTPNLAWLSIFPILAICAMLLFLGYRKREILLELGRNNSNGDSSIPPWNQLTRSTRSTPTPDTESSPTPSKQSAPDVVPYDPHSYPVEIKEFDLYIKEALASGLLESQYKLFTKGLTKACQYGKLPENKSKNRYKDLMAYDETRVVLNKVHGESHSDYINASYIQGYKEDRAYIATQGPKPNTVNDFWRMIWQEDVRVICMLANVIEGGKTKCHQYWPEVRCNAKYGDILVSHTVNEVFVDHTFRTFVLSFGKDKRVVTHLHYTGWPDHGVPMNVQSLIPYLKKLREMPRENGPVVVHCSAGVGRTGTIILCDICLNRAKEEEIVDLLAVTMQMRSNRANMVDNAQQYLLAHLVIAEYLVSNQTLIPCNNSFREKIKELRKELPSHVKRLKDNVWQDRALHTFGSPEHLIPEDVVRDGGSVLDPVGRDLPVFKPLKTSNYQSKYLTTISVDGMKIKNQYIASPLPSPANWSDLWKKIADENVELVIILQCPDPDDPTCCEILPHDLSPDPTQNIHIEPKTDFDDGKEDFPMDRLILNGDEAEPQPVTVLTCTGWECGKEGKPPPASKLVSLWRASEKISRMEGPTFVVCRDGITGCGLYLALSFLLERMAVAGECDVISAVRAIRRYKPEFVESLDQFEYLYDAAEKYEEFFQTYANFS